MIDWLFCQVDKQSYKAHVMLQVGVSKQARWRETASVSVGCVFVFPLFCQRTAGDNSSGVSQVFQKYANPTPPLILSPLLSFPAV